MKRGVMKFTACCLAAGMTFTGTGTVAFAGKDAPLAGLGAVILETEENAAESDSEVQTVAPVEEKMTESETETEAETEVMSEEQTVKGTETSVSGTADEGTAVQDDTDAADTVTEESSQDEEKPETVSTEPEDQAAAENHEEGQAAENQVQDQDNTDIEDQRSEETEAEAMQTEAPETEPEVDTSLNGTLAFAKCEEYINIRSDASADGEVVGKVYNNGSVTILNKVGNWYEVQTGNATGYVSADYFATGAEAEAIANEVAYNVATVYSYALFVI